MFQIILKTVARKFTFNMVSRSACTCTLRAAALEHKVIDHPVKCNTVIKFIFNKTDKVIHGIRCNFGIEFCFNDVTVFHCDGNDRILCHNNRPLLIK